jgi:ABC-type spermidine/putrescine transport system permease subunit I
VTATHTRHIDNFFNEINSSQQIEDLLAWGFASAIAVVLLASTLVLLGIYNRFAGLDRLWG